MTAGLPRIEVSQLRNGDRVEGVYLLEDFQIRPRKDGGTFLTMVLRDASGKITGVMWDNFSAFKNGAISQNDYIKVTGDVRSHQNQLQVHVSKAEKVPDECVNPEDFLPVTPYPVEELEKEFWALVEKIRDPDILNLVQAIFSKPRFWKRFRRAPSAVTMHQAYLGGLLEHTVMVTKNALKIAENYPAANTDILLAGALLHDIGKTIEFSFEKKIAYTDMGRLIGHIPMGFALIEYEATRLGSPPAHKKVLIQHIVLSHHGYLEFGSPKQPHTLEAVIVHHADQLDAQLSTLHEPKPNASHPSKWEYSPIFERVMFSGSYDNLEVTELLRAMGYSVGLRGKRIETRDEENASDALFGETNPLP
jgi:3'-5' exoribonuclease